MLTKSIAALPTLAVLFVYLVLARAPLRRIVVLLLGPFVIAAPWFLYALVFHFQWFWKEHILTEVLGTNAAGVAIPLLDNIMFYYQRLVWPDPVLAVAGAAALLWTLVRGGGRLVLLWLAFTALALLVFGYHYHGANYLMPAITALALLAGLSMPAMPPRWGVLLLCVLLAAEAWKVSHDSRIVWRGTNLSVAPALVSYCEQHRNHTLMVIQTDDEFFSASQPLPRVRYGLIGQGRAAIRMPIDYQYLGIVVTSAEFENRAQTWSVFRKRLTAMGLPAGLDPRGTEVLFPNEDAIRRFIEDHPEIDFLAPDRDAPPEAGHRITRADGGHVLLWATVPDPETPRAAAHSWSCGI